MVCLVCVFVVLLGILCIFLFFFLSLYIDSWPCFISCCCCCFLSFVVVRRPCCWSSSSLVLLMLGWSGIFWILCEGLKWSACFCGVHLLIIRCWSGLLGIGIDKWRYVEQVVFYIRIWHIHISCDLRLQQVNHARTSSHVHFGAIIKWFCHFLYYPKDVPFPPKYVRIACWGLRNAHVRRCVRAAFFCKVLQE